MSPQDLIADLRRFDPAAKTELHTRFQADIERLVEDFSERYDVDSDPRILVSRLFKSIELWLAHQAPASLRGIGWAAFNAKVLKKVNNLLTQPFEYEQQNPGALSATASRFSPRGQLTSGRYVIRWFSKPVDKVLGDVWDYQARPDGSLVLLIGDVTSHGLLASLVALVIGDVFQACMKAQRDPVDLCQVHAELERRLSPVLSPMPGTTVDDDCNVQTTLLHVKLSDEVKSDMTFVPGEAIRFHVDAPPAVPT